MTERLYYPSTERNRAPILDVLKPLLDGKESLSLLEIASGSGEHITYFAQHFSPTLSWQPSDLDEDCLKSIDAWAAYFNLKNLKKAIPIDTTKDIALSNTALDGILCVNMVHISPWESTIGLMDKAGRTLNKGGFLMLYGPYKRNGEHTAPSNIDFEAWLKEKDPRFGVRDMEAVVDEAMKNSLHLDQMIEMPANNFCLIFKAS